MTIHVNRQEAEKQFSHLFSQVLQGEEIVIMADGEEKARLVPSSRIHIKNNSEDRIPGIDKGRFVVPDDFNDPLPEDILAAFEGESIID